MSDVFVSYKAEDKRRVRPLVDALRTDGFSVWWDEQIDGGATWRHTIEAELNSAKCAIIVWSKRSVGPEGEFVQDEAARAKKLHVYVPVTIDRVQLPLGFGETQVLSLNGWRGSRSDPRYGALVAVVRTKVNGKQFESASRFSRTSFDRRTALGAGAAIAAASAGVGAWALLRPSPKSTSSQTIAVLPFENLSNDPRQAYFGDGIAEEIRSALARLSGLTVIGRSSSEAVRNDDARVAAKKLGVRNILSGTVRQSDAMVRITAELVDGRSGADRWSQDYNRVPGDAIAIQTDIAQNVANALSIQLLPNTKKAMAAGTSDSLAHDAYLQGLALAHADGDEQLERRALALFDTAIARDPTFADAFAAKAELLTVIAFLDPTDATTRTDLARALTAAQTAVKLAPGRSSAQSALGLVLENLGDFKGANQAFQKAIRIGADADTLRRVALFRARIGADSPGLQLLQHAREIDPLNGSIQGDLGIVLFCGRHYGPAIQALSASLQDQPNSSRLRDYLLRSLLLSGRAADAEAQLPKIQTSWIRLVDDALLSARLGDRKRADRALANVIAINADLIAFQLAEIHAQRHEIDQAIDQLRKAISLHDAGLQSLPTDPFLDPLRSDPRFASLLQSLDFPRF